MIDLLFHKTTVSIFFLLVLMCCSFSQTQTEENNLNIKNSEGIGFQSSHLIGIKSNSNIGFSYLKNGEINLPEKIFNRVPDSILRKSYLYLNIGIIEPLALGIGFQLNFDLAIGIKWGGYWLAGGTFVPNSGAGFGLKISQNKKLWVFNNINYEITLFYKSSNQDSNKKKVIIKGGAVDINIGNESANNNGFNFIWSVGIVGSLAQGSPLLILPNLKIGLNFNF